MCDATKIDQADSRLAWITQMLGDCRRLADEGGHYTLAAQLDHCWHEAFALMRGDGADEPRHHP